jgi:hypothetical protein
MALRQWIIQGKNSIKELLKTGHFSAEAKSYIIPAVIHGMFKKDALMVCT